MRNLPAAPRGRAKDDRAIGHELSRRRCAGLLAASSCAAWSCRPALSESPSHVEFPADVLVDKIRGGMLGQIVGNLNGLPHEAKYMAPMFASIIALAFVEPDVEKLLDGGLQAVDPNSEIAAIVREIAGFVPTILKSLASLSPTVGVFGRIAALNLQPDGIRITRLEFVRDSE